MFSGKVCEFKKDGDYQMSIQTEYDLFYGPQGRDMSYADQSKVKLFISNPETLGQNFKSCLSYDIIIGYFYRAIVIYVRLT